MQRIIFCKKLCAAFMTLVLLVPQSFAVAATPGKTSATPGRTEVKIYLTTTGAGTWVVPPDWDSSNNTIEVIGGGGGGAGINGMANGGGGGGGGAYAKISNLTLTPDASVTYQVGTAGSTGSPGTAGGDTYFNGTGSTCAAQSVCAKGGSGGTVTTAGAGGPAGSSIGTITASGGTGGNGGVNTGGGGGGGGGGGAAGPHGAGADGGAGFGGGSGIGGGGGGGGGANSGSAGTDNGFTGGNGVAGGDGRGGTGGGPANTDATAGTGGGGGGGQSNTAGGNGALDPVWSSVYGPGGGGGGGGGGVSSASDVGGTSSGYGSGGGGGGHARNTTDAVGGVGTQGIIVITYRSSNVVNQLAKGLVGYWPLDGNQTNWSTGQTQDLSGQARVGQLVGMSTTTSPTNGKIGQAIKFDGVNDYVSFTSPNLASASFSVSGWVYTTSLSANGAWFAVGTSATADNIIHLLVLTTGAFRFGFWSDDLDTGTGVITTNKWYHITVTYDVATLAKKIYVNGALVTSNTGQGPYTGNTTGNIGRNGDATAYWKGNIDDVRIYNYALSTGEVSKLYGAGSATFNKAKRIYLTSGTSWTVPSDWNSNANTVEVIGGGGGGGTAVVGSAPGGGGGGGGYSLAINQTLTPGSSVIYAIGAAGGVAAAGGDTWFCNTTSNCASIAGSAVIAGAEGGNGASGRTGGAGGTTATAVGSTKRAGGTGGTANTGGSSWGGAAGAGAAGPIGAGKNGGGTVDACGGAGGGGNGGGTAGTDGLSNNTAGDGGNNSFGYGGGVGATTGGQDGTHGGGGAGGGGSTSAVGGDGGAGIEWDANHGSGGGGGGGGVNCGGSNVRAGGAGGLYGGGGGGGSRSSGSAASGAGGAQGIVVITYTPYKPVTQYSTVYLTNTAGTTWRVPSDWNSAANTIEVIGGGGGGAGGAGGGGGGGAYSKITNLSLTSGGSITYQVGSGGTTGSSISDPGIDGGDTFFNRTSGSANTCADTSSVCAKGGTGGSANGGVGTGGAGGVADSGIGSTKYSGGAGADGVSNGHGGAGGGAAGLNGAGGDAVTTTGGAGDAGFGGAGGVVGDPGTSGGNGAEWDATHGSGGGGGGVTANPGSGGGGGAYGGGAGGTRGSSTGNNASQGLIVIRYIPISKTTIGVPNTSLGSTNSLVGYWPFDGKYVNWATGVVSDISGNSNSGQLVAMSTTTSAVAGKNGQALKFDGSSTYISFTSPSLANASFSVAGWVYEDDASSNRAWFTVGSSGTANNALHMQVDSTGAVSMRFFSNNLISSAGIFTTNAWHHIIGTYNVSDGARKIYLDGVLVASETGAAAFTGDTVGNIGRKAYDGTAKWSGKIDDVRLYNRALTWQEVQQLYKATK